MPTQVYNPGEPVFDPITGEPYIDENGALVEVAPGLKVEIPGTDRTLEGDDVANAAWYQSNLYEGEVIRDRAIGVPYQRLALGQSDPGVAVTVTIAEVKARTPGVVGVVGVKVLGHDHINRILRYTATFLRADGSSTTATIPVG